MGRGTMRIFGGALVGALLVAPRALAQTSGPIAPLAPPSTGDQGGDAGAFSGWVLSSPLRLSLQGNVAPMAGGFPQCAALQDDVGNSVGGIPVQHYGEVRLMPRLVLSVFSQLGCPIDAGMGAAMTYEVPLRKTVSLVFGAGTYAAPGQVPLYGGFQSALLRGMRGLPSPVNAAGRVDLVWKTQDGHPLNLGVQTRGRTQQLTFGGGF
jgi:hypothetical protein